MGKAIQLDLDGKGSEARALIQKEIDQATTPAAKAAAQRAMAMSWGFDANCSGAVEYEQMVIAYWVTREKEEPANAFYQQGEMANEAARVCIDSGDLNMAQTWYRKGTELGLKEPGISADRKALWAYRLAHAEARIAARRGNRREAEKQIAAARSALDGMTTLRAQQEPFLPYLTGYVAFYLGDTVRAIADLEKANQSDPFIQCLLGQAWEKQGDSGKAKEFYTRALQTTAHNPPAAYAKPFARKKLN
ncbi:MAG: Tetratricopeptide 2 repeat protein [Bryobacterales bacterium]|nr:Tetratricopeptide 2 repeat protein [Bryobacterales bacterium]